MTPAETESNEKLQAQLEKTATDGKRSMYSNEAEGRKGWYRRRLVVGGRGSEANGHKETHMVPKVHQY